MATLLQSPTIDGERAEGIERQDQPPQPPAQAPPGQLPPPPPPPQSSDSDDDDDPNNAPRRQTKEQIRVAGFQLRELYIHALVFLQESNLTPNRILTKTTELHLIRNNRSYPNTSSSWHGYQSLLNIITNLISAYEIHLK